MRMALLAEPLTAREAYDAGLVTPRRAATRSSPALVETIVRRLAAGPPLAYAATKKAVNAATLGPLEGALERERTGPDRAAAHRRRRRGHAGLRRAPATGVPRRVGGVSS